MATWSDREFRARQAAAVAREQARAYERGQHEEALMRHFDDDSPQSPSPDVPNDS